jgi:hypothetical protein
MKILTPKKVSKIRPMTNTTFVLLGVDGKFFAMSYGGHIAQCLEGGFHKVLPMVGWKITC